MKERINKRKKGVEQESNTDTHIEIFLKNKSHLECKDY